MIIDIRQLICDTAKGLVQDDPIREVRMRSAEHGELIAQIGSSVMRFNGLPIVIDETAPLLPRKKMLQRSPRRA